MKLPNYVKPMPKLLLLISPKVKGATLGNIYLPEEIFTDLQKENPDPINISLLIHEEEHRKNSSLSNIIRYALFPKARLNEELGAYKVQFKYLKSKRATYDIENVARNLSGFFYFYSTNYKNAKRLLEKAWNES